MSDSSLLGVGVGLSALGILGPAIALGLAASKTMEGIARQPEKSNDIFLKGIIFAALCEALGLLAFLLGLFLNNQISSG